MLGVETHTGKILQLYIIKWPLLSAIHMPSPAKSPLTTSFNRHHLISVPCFYDKSNKTTRKLHGNVTKIVTIKKPFFFFVLGWEVQRSHCRKIEPIWFGVNSYICTHSLRTNAREKSCGHELTVQTDHLHIQLGERRNQKIQLLHLRYPKLLLAPKPVSRMKTTWITSSPTLACVPLVTGQLASTAHCSKL